MRVGHFLAHFPSPGGTSTMLRGLAGGLVELGHVVFVYGCGRTPAEADDEAPALTTRVFSGSMPSVPVKIRGRRAAFVRRLSENPDRLDICVIHGMFSLTSPAVADACRRARIPYIACPHDPYSPKVFGRHRVRKELYWRLYEAPFLRGAAAIHVLAPSHVDDLRARGITTRTFVVPNGVGRAWLQGAVRPTASPTGRFTVLYYGRLDTYNKGLDLLLGAIAHDDRVRSTCRLEIAGRASAAEAAELERLIARFGLENDVAMRGFVPDVDALVRTADLVILPSRFDGFGQVVLESLAVGTPVVVSSGAGAAEFLGPADGVVVAEPEAASVARALLKATGSLDALRKATTAAHARLSTEFDWRSIADRWVSEIRALGITTSA